MVSASAAVVLDAAAADGGVVVVLLLLSLFRGLEEGPRALRRSVRHLGCGGQLVLLRRSFCCLSLRVYILFFF